MYTNIKISVTNLFLDPIICMFIPFSVCKNFSCRRRQQLIALAEDKFSEDLDILSILKRLSQSQNTIEILNDDDQRKLLNFSND